MFITWRPGKVMSLLDSAAIFTARGC